MLTDSALVLPRLAAPRSFTALMSLYESNYLRLNWLVPDPAAVQGAHVSQPAGDQALHLSHEETCRYTTTLRLTYWFDDPDGSVADPDLRIRVYHDARLVEAMACGTHRRHHALAGFARDSSSELERRWARNMLLNKWLEYCSERFHRFGTLASPA